MMEEGVSNFSVIHCASDVAGAASRAAGGSPRVIHSADQVREILTAFGFLTADRYSPFQAGVLTLHDRSTELLFVTLDKSSGYHARISYRDYAISPSRFHWQTQNAAAPETAAGRRYLESAANGWTFQLFVRARKGDAYRACGPVYLADPAEDVSGSQPMNIEWTLRVPLPAELFGTFSVLRG
jgi:hypothetical protein